MTINDSHAVTVTSTDGITTLHLNRPDSGNSLNLAMAQEIRDAVKAIGADPSVRVLVFAAAGRMFCAGGDVREMAAASDREAFLAELAGTIHDGLIALRALPIPVVAAVQGTAAGAGIGLVLAADFAVASTTATFVAAYSGIGLSPDCGVSALLPSAIGTRRAARMLITNEKLDAATAADWGLVTETCAPEAIAPRVAQLARAIAERPGRSAGQAARLARAALDRDYATQLADEGATIAQLSTTPEAASLIEAFASPRS